MARSFPKAVRRVHLVGGSGAGKSTLAGQLGALLTAPVYHLDELNLRVACNRGFTRARRDAEVRRIAATPAWVTEGIFLGWTDPLLQASERIIWLDLAWHIALRRIVWRYIAASAHSTNQYRGLRRLIRFLGWSAAYYRPMSAAQIDALHEENPHSRAATARHLRPYARKVVRCASPAEVRLLLESLQSRDASTSARTERRAIRR